MANTITLTGWKEFERLAKNMPKILEKEVDEEVQEASREWAQLAKQAAPVDQGFLVGKISAVKIKEGEAETVSAADYSAYLEWGTRMRVSVPGELSAYASQFRGMRTTSPFGPKAMIYAWCKRVGIPPDRWWAVYISVMVKGIHPHPYFFIQQPKVQANLFKNVQNILNTEH